MLDLLALTFLAVVVAGTAHAVTGFGFALVLVPLMTLLTEPRTAVVTVTTLGLLMTALGWWRERAQVVWRPVVAIGAGAVVGIPLGLSVFAAVPESALSLAIGVTVLALVALLVSGVRLPGGRGVQVGAGVVSGAMVGTTGINGPPLVLGLQAAGLGPAAFRATLQPLFALQGVVVVGGFAVLGLYDATDLAVVAAGVPALWLGWWLGDRVFARLPADRVRAVVLATLAVSGAVVVVTALGGA